MTKSIVCTVLTGILVGAAAYFMPHLLLGILIFFGIISLLHCGHRRHGCCGHNYGHERMFYMADRIRKMTDEEYEEFKTKMSGGCCDNGYHRHGHCCSSKDSEEKECCQSKKEEKTGK
jgi:hypothetical protein